MSRKLRRRGVIASLVILASAALIIPIALKAASSSNVLQACVNPGNGNMRLVNSSAACHANETFVEWNVEGPQGPPGQQGPQGPPGTSSGGPPYVWVCTPAHLPNGVGGPRDDVYVFNGSTSTANIAVNILDRDGKNLTGVTIPGVSPAVTYPGEAGSSTVTLDPGHTRDVTWQMPTAGSSPDPDIAVTVRVTSDQPIVVGANFQFNGNIPSQCNLLPK